MAVPRQPAQALARTAPHCAALRRAAPRCPPGLEYLERHLHSWECDGAEREDGQLLAGSLDDQQRPAMLGVSAGLEAV
jgi:hypothetical protein